MNAMLFAHGDLILLPFLLIVEALKQAADNAVPIIGVLLRLVGVLLVLPIIVLVMGFLCGIFSVIFVRKKRWLFPVVVVEALVFYGVFCVLPAHMLVMDWHPFWAWLTIGLGGLMSMLAGLLNASLLVSIIALFTRLTRKPAEELRSESASSGGQV